MISSQKCNVTNYPTENKRPQKISSLCGSQQPARCVAAERERERARDSADYCNNHHNYISHTIHQAGELYLFHS
jgi:hypothetical protein